MISSYLVSLLGGRFEAVAMSSRVINSASRGIKRLLARSTSSLYLLLRQGVAGVIIQYDRSKPGSNHSQ